MKILPLIAAASIACALPAPEALAQPKHYRGGHWHGGYHPHRHYGPRYYSWAPYRPYAYWPGPLLAYSYPVYPPAPVVVERVYEAPPRYYYEAPRVERPQPYPVPPRAEARPAPAAPKVAAIPEPKVERYTLSARELFEFDKATLRKPQRKLD